MDQRLTLVTLGVADVARARAFYERIGWRASSASQDSIVFFQAGGIALALFGRADLAADAAVPVAGEGVRAVAIAINLRSSEATDAAFTELVAAGAEPVKPPKAAPWGGYSGYCANPDGHLIEVAYNPFWPLDEVGMVHLPD